MSRQTEEALVEAAEYFENESLEWQLVERRADSPASHEIARFDRLARAVRTALRALSSPTPLEAQVREAIAIIEGGTDYDRIHVASILRNGLRALSAPEGTEAPEWFVEEVRQSVGTIMNAGDAETEAKRERAEANHLWSARPSPETGASTSAPGEPLEAILRRMERSAHNEVQPSVAYWCREIRHALSSPETGVERERLAKLVDVEVRSREASAGDARRVYADKRVAAFEAEAADWRAIASIVRFASPGVREETIQGVLMVFVSDGYVLMERCPKKAARHGGEWFIPGGRIEPGELPFEAFIRETREELGVSVPDCAALPLVDATGGEAFGSFLMRPYLVTRWEGCIPHVSLDHPDVPLRWVPFEEAHRSPAAAVRAIMAYVDRPGGEQPA